LSTNVEFFVGEEEELDGRGAYRGVGDTVREDEEDD